jgi:sulfopyruvate decarboxylase alpha subunit
MNTLQSAAAESSPWASVIHEALSAGGVRHVSYVPDAGHAQLIELALANPVMKTTVLTTEEEGVAIAAGAWLGGVRSVLLMQSSGAGNCINMLSLMASCRLPFLTIITMRGEWAEFNPWQVPMGRATAEALALMGMHPIRVDALEELPETLSAAITLAFDSEQAVAVILSQRMLGRKKWVVK